jgi:hypothetical protein
MMRRTVWVVWLCLALLPLRGMAHAVMLGAGASHGAVAVQPAGNAPAPCPMHVAPTADDAAAPAAGATATYPASATAGTCCHLCAVCHGAAMPTATVAAVGMDPPHVAPLGHDGPGAGRVAPDGLFRPPR